MCFFFDIFADDINRWNRLIESTNSIINKFKALKNEKNVIMDVSIYFYDPIIEGKSGSQYQMKIYNTGNVLFGVTAK